MSDSCPTICHSFGRCAYHCPSRCDPWHTWTEPSSRQPECLPQQLDYRLHLAYHRQPPRIWAPRGSSCHALCTSVARRRSACNWHYIHRGQLLHSRWHSLPMWPCRLLYFRELHTPHLKVFNDDVFRLCFLFCILTNTLWYYAAPLAIIRTGSQCLAHHFIPTLTTVFCQRSNSEMPTTWLHFSKQVSIQDFTRNSIFKVRQYINCIQMLFSAKCFCCR